MLKNILPLSLICCLVFVSLLLEKLERWLQLMLKWSPQERGKDPGATPSDCFSQLELILQLKVISPLFFVSSLCIPYADCKKSFLTIMEFLKARSHITSSFHFSLSWFMS